MRRELPLERNEALGACARELVQSKMPLSDLLKLEKVLAYRFTGTRFDCGSKLGFMKANVEFALQHPEIAADFARYLHDRLASINI